MPLPASTGSTDMWMCVMVGIVITSSQPSSSRSRSSISTDGRGLPSRRDHDGCVPQRAMYSGMEAMTSSSRSRPR